MSKNMTQTPSGFNTQNNSTQSTYLPLLCATKFEPILVLLIQKMVSNLNLHLKLLFGSFCKITPVSQYEGVWLRIPLMHWACCWPNNIGYLIVYPIGCLIGCPTECFPLSVWLTVHSESPAIQDIPPLLRSFACVFCVFAAGLTKCWGRLWRQVLTEYLLCVTTRQFTNKILENSNVWIHFDCMARFSMPSLTNKDSETLSRFRWKSDKSLLAHHGAELINRNFSSVLLTG